MSLKLTYNNGLFTLSGVGFDNIDKVKTAGFKSNKVDGWFTNKVMSASLLRDYADEKAENIFKRSFLRHSPWKGKLIIPKGLSLLKGQPEAIAYSMSRNKSYLALAPGRGKTIVAAIVAAIMGVRTLVICPPFLALNTEEEFKKWAPSLTVKILGTNDWEVPDVLIVPDSQIINEDVRRYIRFFDPQLLEIDEAHRYKDIKSARTKGLLGYRNKRDSNKRVPGIVDAKSLEKLIYLGGTPSPNGRPIELHSIFYKSFPEFINFYSHDEFGMEYCSPRWNGFGYDFSGCNVKRFKALMDKVKGSDGFMMRLGKDIDLPPLTEETVIVGADVPITLKKMETDLLKQYSPDDLVRQIIAQEEGKEGCELHLSTYLRLLGMHKAEVCVDYIDGILDFTDENLLVFAIHKDVIKLLNERLKKYNPIMVTGDTNKKLRHQLVKQFQNDLKKRLFIGNIDAVGIGYTLTKADRVLFLEESMVPGTNRQAIDRAHRYTLEHPLLSQTLIYRNSFDRIKHEMLKRKEHITSFV